MINSASLDTNVLVYAFDNSIPEKHHLCAELLERFIAVRGRIPLQCLNEFYALTTRKGLMQPSQAGALVQNLLGSLVVIPSTISDTVRATQIHEKYKIQFFDALLLATDKRAGCTHFLSEDMQDDREYDGITVRNPLSPTFSMNS